MTLPATEDNKPARPGMPDWLLQQIETKTGGLRNARWKRCGRCQELTLAGLDDDLCAVHVTVDPTPITPTQETWCAINSRRTYAVEILDRKVKILSRDPYGIGRPPLLHKIVPEHVCGHRYPGFLLKRPTSPEDNQEPPF